MNIASDILELIDPISGEVVTYRITNTWYDGSIMDDDKIDGYIYKKIDNIYYRRLIDDKTLLKISNVNSLRSFNGYYEGQEVILLGYYTSGDKKPIIYKFTIEDYNILVDDGGHIIKTDIGSWIGQFNDSINIKDFGAVENQNIDSYIDKILLYGMVNNIEVSKGNYKISSDYSIILTSNKKLILDEEAVITKLASATIKPIVIINGDNTEVSGGKFIISGNSLHQGVINIISGNNIKLSKNKFENATIGIWVCPEENDTVDNLMISHHDIKLTKYGIILGKGSDAPPVGFIEKVNIVFGKWSQGKIINENGDGIKTTQRVKELIISHNFIDAPSRDCIDLFASGEKVVISHNVLSNAVVKAVDIKREPIYSESVYGVNGDNIIISNNFITGMSIGIGISGNYEAGNYKSNRFININSNIFEKITTTAISASGRYINIISNHFINNSYNLTTHYPTITVGTDFGSANTVTNNINISSNSFVNNAVSNTIKGSVIRVSNYCNKISIIGNNIINDLDKERPFQDIGIHVNSNSDALIKDNSIDVITKPLQIITGAIITGESRSFYLGNKPADKIAIIKLFKCTKAIQLVTVDYSVSAAIPAEAVNYSTANALIGTATAVAFNNITAIDNNINRKNISPTVFKANVNDDIVIRYDKGGTGTEFKDLTVTFNFIEI
ncbi:hypothetical protein BN1195_02640 [Chryseobacterium oranimense G311]|uniref:hypothetical protein n=1 Tax=Chryseobacterium oranimense TaxID=421058 RepID=UPI000533AB81|nr:hypothetical protein [Chryseobacterium oranimense]CEJ70334.1 hypothetical protein BN1195_02640 [Chryseobacterium oranimense G311]